MKGHTHTYILTRTYISRGIDVILIKLPWLKNSANTYKRHTDHWTAVSTLLSLVSSSYRDLHHWRSNQQTQNAETEGLPQGHQSMTHISNAESTTYGKNARPRDLMCLESTFFSGQRIRPPLGLYLSKSALCFRIHFNLIGYIYIYIYVCMGHIYIYIYIYISWVIYIYIYIERERERMKEKQAPVL